MKIKLDYGEKGLIIDAPLKNLLKIVEIKHSPPLKNVENNFIRSFENPIISRPLREIAYGKKNACIVISDLTRPIPYRDILPIILGYLISAGIKKANITILIATGIHRPMTEGEIDAYIGRNISGDFKVINHFSGRKKEHVYLGRTKNGTRVYIDRRYLDSELKIITGLIEPHLLAGYSGGRKAVCPGLVADETIRFAHGPDIIDHPGACVGVLKGNPFHEEAVKIAKKAGVDFCINITINKDRKITGVFSGDFEKAHLRGAKFLERYSKIAVPAAPDIIITTGGGEPLDNTFYQSVKGVNSVKNIIKKGGIVILASCCREGVGSDDFKSLLLKAKSANQIMAKIRSPDFFQIDQWMVQHLCQVLERAEVYLFSENIRRSPGNLVKSIPTVEAGIKVALNKLGQDAKIVVIPSGPYIVPFLKK